MSISFPRYVDITSGLGAATAAAQRDLIGRFISSSNLIPTGSVQEFTSSIAVANYFGSDTDEARIAAFYFSYVSQSLTSPNRISYARWADADTAPTVIGAVSSTTLAQFQAVTAGSIEITLGSTTQIVSAIDLSSASSLTDVASTMQTAIRASVVDNQFDSATVVFDAVNQWFTLTGGVAEVAAVAVTAGSLADLLGWGATARFSPGVLTQTITEVLNSSTQVSNNFGSFAFIDTLTVSQATEAATWNDGNNLLYIFSTPVTVTDAGALSTAIIGLGGTGMTLDPEVTNQYPEVLPMAAFAATNYTRSAAVINFMFIQSGSLTPSVTDDTAADLYDGLRINFYGRTQVAGQNLSFYQRGVLTGTGTDPLNMNIFANEIWLKDAAGVALINLLTAVRVSANNAGRAAVLTVLRNGPIEQALINGTISVGRTLSAQDRVFISQISGDPQAFQQVQNAGYWLDAQIVEEVNNGVTESIVEYTLIYAADQVIRKVEGSHAII